MSIDKQLMQELTNIYSAKPNEDADRPRADGLSIRQQDLMALARELPDEMRQSVYHLFGLPAEGGLPPKLTPRQIMQAHNKDAQDTPNRLAFYIVGKLSLYGFLSNTMLDADGTQDLLGIISESIKEAARHFDPISWERLRQGKPEMR